jgi:GAF domain/AMIN domain
MSIETRHRSTARWIPDADPDRKNLETILAFAYGMQMGHLRRISEDLTQLARQAKLATMAAGAAIAVEHQHRIECIARSGDAAPQLGSRPAANIGLAGECLRTAEPQFCGDTETHPFVDRMHSRTFGVRSIVYVPVFRGEKPEGVIGVFADKANHFTPHDVRVLQMIAREVSRTLKWEISQEPAPVVPAPEVRKEVRTEVRPPALPEVLAEAQPEPRITTTTQAITMVASAMPELAEPVEEIEQAEVKTEIRPLFEPELSSFPPLEEVEEPSDFDWKRSDEDLRYPAKATNYLFSEEHPVRRWVSIITATLAVVFTILGVWWAVPRWTADNNLEPTADYIARTQQAIPPAPSTAQASTQYAAKPGLRPAMETAPNLVFVRDVRTQVNGGHVFVTIHLSGPVQFQTQQIPERIYVDLHGVQLSPLLKATRVDPAGPIAQFRLAPGSEPDVIRMTMVLDAPCTFLVSVTSDPQAIILDVQPQRGVIPSR